MGKTEATVLPMPKLCAIKGCDKFALKSASIDSPEPYMWQVLLTWHH